jgi:archaellum component FlaC
MKKISMVLVFFLAPSFAWDLGRASPDNQGLHYGTFDTKPVALADGILAKTEVENFPSLTLDARTGNSEVQNLTDASELEGKEDEEDSGEFWTIGKFRLIIKPKANPPLKERSAGRSSLRSYNFVGKVGGVNFEQVAVPDAETASKTIELSYHKEALDGFRLLVKVGSTTFRPPIADWLLIPIAEFAESDFTSATSLFGEGPDTDNFYYIKYHPAFKDSLLGMRLLQADILLMNPKHTSSLPKRNGQVVLGHGEFLPMKSPDHVTINTLAKLMNRQKATSWVLTDIDAPASFSIQNGEFRLRSFPYYYFWSRNEDAIHQYQEKEKVYKSRVDAYNRKVTSSKNRVNQFNDPVRLYQERGAAYKSQVDAYNRKVTSSKNRVNQFNDLVSRYNANNASVSKLKLDRLKAEIQRDKSELNTLDQELKRLKRELDTVNAVIQGDKAELDAFQQELKRLEMDLEEIESGLVNPMPALTHALKNQPDLLKNINPVVVKAVYTTAEYASFFRYIKSNHPHTWKGFLQSIANVTIRPAVKTPTHMPKKNPVRQ